MIRFNFAGLFFLAPILSAALAQTPSNSEPTRTDKYGTCSATIMAPFGAAFIIDSRVTEVSDGNISAQYPVCKVLLARPTILLAGVGLADTTGRTGHWNSLDQAAQELKNLPANPTDEQINQWAFGWGDTLITHFRQAGETPTQPAYPLSELILITRIGNQFYFKRAGVEWDGTRFNKTIEGQILDESLANVEYAGWCRQFVSHQDWKGEWHEPLPRTEKEVNELAYWRERKTRAKTVDDLSSTALGLELLMTKIAEARQGLQAVIAPPYAKAEWAVGKKGWTTRFNSECRSSATSAASGANKP